MKSSNASALLETMAPVVIAGAGPVGCTLALYLAQNGIPVVLLDRATELPQDLRASTFHPPTLDQLDRLGLTQRLIPQGLVVRDFQFRERRTGEVAAFDLAHLTGETGHPYRLQCEQYKLTREVVAMLEHYPHARFQSGMRVVGYREADGKVDALLFDGENEEQLRGSFLVGCDGAGSSIRQASGTLFEGLTYPERFLVISTSFPFEQHFENLSWVNYVSDPDEWCVMLKTRDLWRVQFPTSAQADPAQLLSDDFIEDRLQHLCPKPGRYEIEHRTLYKVHQRVAETYRVGQRVLLAGDAAHVNNPLGGMGMNGGIHDAINLGEKLCAVILDHADRDHQLDSYNLQRRQICIDFIQQRTRENKAMMETDDEAQRANRQQKYMDIAADPVRAKAYLMESSMIDCLRASYEIAV